ncbi:MAG: EI24 domain-containing protein [Betaproteobacteria bacterium]
MTRSLLYALMNALHPRMLWLMVWPMLVSLAVWGTVALVFWMRAAMWIADKLRGWIESSVFAVTLNYADAAVFVAHALLVLFFVPVVVLTALLILGAFGMPAMVEHVASRNFPQLARRNGGSSAGGVWNSVLALLGMVGLGIASVPLWLLPPLWPLIPVLILSWVNQQVLRYDAVAEHADSDEMRTLFRGNRGALYGLGFALALLAYVPVVGLFAPVIVGLAFIHLLLGKLEALRAAPIEGKATRL